LFAGVALLLGAGTVAVAIERVPSHPGRAAVATSQPSNAARLSVPAELAHQSEFSTTAVATPLLPAATAAPPVLPAPSAEPPVPAGAPPPAVSAAAAVVLDDKSGEVLFEKAGDQQLAIASLTKIATAVVALEEGDLDSVATVDVDSRTMTTSTLMGLLPGDRFTLRDLLYGLMLPSGNDAALAIARQVSGSDAAFVEEMNALAARLGLEKTHFANPHGLRATGHISSARDVAALSRYAMSVPGFAEIVATPSWTARGSRTISFSNINPFIFDYAGGDGLKTGFTRQAGPTIAASATREGHRLYLVLLNAPARDQDARVLMDWAFRSFRWPQG
jgi:D-alanyl-D-alanine carboxypeptidase